MAMFPTSILNPLKRKTAYFHHVDAGEIVETPADGRAGRDRFRLPTTKTQVDGAAVATRRQEVREKFEILTHKRLIDIFERHRRRWDAIMKLDLPAGRRRGNQGRSAGTRQVGRGLRPRSEDSVMVMD